MLDKDGDGALGIEELLQLAHSLRLSLSRKELEQAKVEMDTDADGVVTWSDFSEWKRSNDFDQIVSAFFSKPANQQPDWR